MPETAKRFPWLLTLIVVPAVALLIGLGVWQIQRLAWKQGLIAQADAVSAEPPRPLNDLIDAADLDYRKAIVVCPGLSTAPYLELQTIHDGQPGTRLISVCDPPDLEQAFLIDRGFIAETDPGRPRVALSIAPQSIMVDIRTVAPPGPMALPPSGNRFFARDTQAMGRALGQDRVSQFTLFALTSTNPELPRLQAFAPPVAFSNNHLGYAATWFGLALALIGIYVAMLRRPRQKDPT